VSSERKGNCCIRQSLNWRKEHFPLGERKDIEREQGIGRRSRRKMREEKLLNEQDRGEKSRKKRSSRTKGQDLTKGKKLGESLEKCVKIVGKGQKASARECVKKGERGKETDVRVSKIWKKQENCHVMKGQGIG